MANRDEDEAAPLFFYGTLRDPELRGAVLGAGGAALRVENGALLDRRAVRMADEAFPLAIDAVGAAAEGVLVWGADREVVRRAEAFEGPEYRLSAGRARLEGGDPSAAAPIACRFFAPSAAAAGRATDEPWDLGHWTATQKPRALREAAELALYREEPPQALGDRLWPEIRARAAAGAGAEAERIGAAFDRSDVEELSRLEVYRGFYGLQEVTVRHRRYGAEGGWTPPVLRGLFRAGDGAVVLPYDPRSDRVLFVEQWRIGLWGSGLSRPWSIEAVAGRIDPGDTAEETVRREAVEEAGIAIGRLEPIGSFVSSPGAMDETLHYFCGEADLSAAGGLYGLAYEHEDIRAFAIDYEAAMTALARGEIAAAPPALALLWLSRNRERLRLLWR